MLATGESFREKSGILPAPFRAAMRSTTRPQRRIITEFLSDEKLATEPENADYYRKFKREMLKIIRC
jgi:hypothetical protein